MKKLKNQMGNSLKNFRLIKVAASMFILALVLLCVILAKNILFPLAFAWLLAYLLYPVVWKLEKLGIHRIPSILIVIIIVLLVAAAIGLYFSVQVASLQFDVEGLKQKVLQQNNSLQGWLGNVLGMDTSTVDNFVKTAFNRMLSALASESGNVFSTTTTTLFQIFILPVFTYFILFYRTKTAYFIFRLTGKKNRGKTVDILRQVSTVTSRYLAGLLGVVAILSVLNTLGLTIIGVPHALVLGVGAALLNLIPYFGTLIGALIPVFYVLFSMEDPLSTILKIAIMFTIVQFLENNIITPNVVGNNIRINALTIIVGLLFGNLIWGIGGMLIIIPYIAIVKIVMRNIESLEPFAYLLSSRGLEKHQVHVSKYFVKLKEKTKKLWSEKL